MFYRALKSVLLLAFTLSVSSMASESSDSSLSAQSQGAAALDKQPQSSATLESQAPGVQPSSSASAPAKQLSKWQTLPEVNASWMNGERLEYELSWGFITAGYATLEVKPRKDGKVEFLTFGTFHNKSLIRFNRDGKKAVLSDTVFKDPVKHYVKRSADTSVTIDGLEHSIMSAFYLVRTLPLKEGETSRFSAVSGKKRYELKVIVHKRETIKTDLGTFKTVKVEPVLDGDGIFNSSGRIFIWFTDDEKRLPVLMQCEIKLGSIKAELKKAK